MERSGENQRPHILLVLTGGTIGTLSDAEGTRRLATEDGEAEPMLIRALRERAPEAAPEVTVRVPYQVLSEHMTLEYLERLAYCLRAETLTEYDGVFITHGSDTLAFTAAFLGELLRGCPVPVFLLATQRPIGDPGSNGVENTLAALQLLGSSRGRTGVYVTYRNSDNIMYLHRAEELKQCQPGTDDFFSKSMQPVPERDGSYQWPEGEFPKGESSWELSETRLRPDVLLLHPYVGIRYDCISLTGIRAAVHTLYHSSTAPKELADFLDRCREAGVKCYILPCEPENCHYETTAELLAHGAIPISGMTEESAYMKLLLGKL
jgi:L-asparaginase